MTKYRVREQYGQFFLEKKVWLFGWVSIYQDLGRYQKALQYPTIEQAFQALEVYQDMQKATTPVYHYPQEGGYQPQARPSNGPPSQQKPPVAR